MKTTTINESPVVEILNERYCNDTVLLIATAKDHIPNVRCVDTFYHEGSFWIVTDLRCNYVKEIQSNENVMISDGGHNRLWCKANVTGHPLDLNNQKIREVFLKVFRHWYQEVNNENLKTVCYIKVTPYKGYLHKDKLGYLFDMTQNSVKISDITHHIDAKITPFW